MENTKRKMLKGSICGIFLSYNSRNFRRRLLSTKTEVRISPFKHTVSTDWPIGSDHPSVESCKTSQSQPSDVIVKFLNTQKPTGHESRTDGQHVWDSPFHAVVFTPLVCINFRYFLTARFASHDIMLVTNSYGLVPT